MSTFTNRIESLRGLFSDRMTDSAALDAVIQGLDLLDESMDAIESTAFSESTVTTIRRSIDESLNATRSLAQDFTTGSVLAWLRGTLGSLEGAIASTGASNQSISLIRGRVRQQSQDVMVLLDHEAFRARAADALEAVETAASNAREAAGVSGSSSLATYFAEYARVELRSATAFRWLTVACVVGAAVLAILLPRSEPSDWTGLVYRLAFLTAIGTLATYFGRQAGQHRRLYNWARSLEVQLKSFPALVSPLQGAAHDDAYRLLATRVLASIPEKGIPANDEPLTAAQAIDLVNAISRRSGSAPTP